MRIPFRLTRRATPTPADAFLLPAEDLAPLARVFPRLCGEGLPGIYPVRGGFLIVPRRPPAHTPVGAIRLRRLAGDLYLPTDADLAPALLPDEVVDLTRDRGLVFLPGGPPLAFDPTEALPVGAWLTPAVVRRGAWESFPPRPARADRLAVIERPLPPDAVVEALCGPPDADLLPGAGEPGGTGAIPDDVRPPAGSLPGRAAAGLALGIGKGFAWLGSVLRSPGLARAGAGIVRRALGQAPRLTEQLLGAQEAALREVLRQLREGDVERALRRAPIAVPDPDQPARIGASADLGTRDPRYSLRSLIAAGGGTAAAWLGGGDVWGQLAREYRRLAEEATRRGDYRRAAYLYGVLLRDLRSAANVLMAGGLYRDAAVIFRDRLNDHVAAAAAFDRAGEYDEAVRLYDRAGQYESAAEILRRLGDEDRAVEYFRRAADALAATGRWPAAGDLLRTKVGREDLAADYYRRGWDSRGAEAVACGERLLDAYLVAGAVPAIRALAVEAEQAFAPPLHREAGRFFNYALSVGPGFIPEGELDDLADRARRVFAGHVRAVTDRARAGAVADDLFGPGTVWPGPVVRDAGYAARRSDFVRVAPGPAVADTTSRLATGTVTAVAIARDTFDIVVATTDAVVMWRIREGRVVPVAATGGYNVAGVSVTPDGGVVYVLTWGDAWRLRCYGTDGPRIAFEGEVSLPADNPNPTAVPYLQPSPQLLDGLPVVTLVPGGMHHTFRGRSQLAVPSDMTHVPGGSTCLLASEAGWEWNWDTAFARGRPSGSGSTDWRRAVLPWFPTVPTGSPLASPPLDWLTPDPGVLQVTGIDREGVLYWSQIDCRESTARPRTIAETHPEKFQASCLIAPGVVAAATGGNEIHWFRAVGTAFRQWAAPTRIAVPARIVFLAARPPDDEVIAIHSDGTTTRVPRAK